MSNTKPISLDDIIVESQVIHAGSDEIARNEQKLEELKGRLDVATKFWDVRLE